MMKLCKRFSYMCMIYITLQPVFWAQKAEVLPQVTGNVGHDVTLPCSFVQGPENSSVSQSQWEFLSPEGNKTRIFVSSKEFGKTVHESHLKGRVDMDDQSLQIKNLELSDAGSYICTINTFPLGLFHETTKLHVQEAKLMSSWLPYPIASGVLLLLMILSVSAYFFYRRCNRGQEQKQVNAGTSETDFASTARKEDVVYSGVKIKKTRHASSSNKNEDSAHPDNVIYSQVFHHQNE